MKEIVIDPIVRLSSYCYNKPIMTIKLDENWDKFIRHCTKQFKENLRKEVGLATKQNAIYTIKKVKQVIRKSVPPDNAPLTVLIKKSSKPLVDKGDLTRSITRKIISPYLAFIGVLRQVKNKKGKPLINIAKTLHDGRTIKVTKKMRAYFYYLAGEVPGVKPLSANTKYITIPPRRFFDISFKDGELIRQSKKRWNNAVNKALRIK
ncbi:MAG: hypothetical protein ABIA04_16455 [Pseudomonadota bacterium]